MNRFKTLLFVVAFLALLFFVSFWVPDNDQKQITSRMAEHGITVKSSERHFFTYGPYYYRGKHLRIYEVETDKGTYWVRMGGWGSPDIEKECDGGYQEEEW